MERNVCAAELKGNGKRRKWRRMFICENKFTSFDPLRQKLMGLYYLSFALFLWECNRCVICVRWWLHKFPDFFWGKLVAEMATVQIQSSFLTQFNITPSRSCTPSSLSLFWSAPSHVYSHLFPLLTESSSSAEVSLRSSPLLVYPGYDCISPPTFLIGNNSF